MANLDLQVLITAKDEASAVLHKFGAAASDVGGTIKDKLKANTVQLGAAFAGVTGVMYGAIKAFDESQASVNQLEAVLKSTGGAAGVTKDEVLELSAALQQQSTFSDESVTGAQNLLLTFTKIGKDIFPEATQTVLDMSVALGQDLKSSSIQLGKALQDPVLGVTALRRVGVSFNEQQLDMIKTMVESGKQLDAQKFILKELATEFGGSALAKSKTFGGQMTILKNNVNDLQETIGMGLLNALSKMVGGGGFGGVSDAIIKLNEFLKTHQDILLGLSVVLIVLAATFGGLFIAALIATAGAAGLVIGALGAIVAVAAFVATMIITHWQQIVDWILQTFGPQIEFAKQVIDTLKVKFDELAAKLLEIKDGILEFFRQKIAEVTQFIYDHKTALEITAGILLLIFGPALATVAGQAIITGIAIAIDLTKKIVALGVETIITAGKMAVEFVLAMVKAIAHAVIFSAEMLIAIGRMTAARLVALALGAADVLKALAAFAAAGWAINSAWAAVALTLAGAYGMLKLIAEVSDKLFSENSRFNVKSQIKALEELWHIDIPGFQTGGFVSGSKPVMVGETGPEVFTPSGNGTITPVARAGGLGGGMNMNVYVGIYAGSQTEKRALAAELYQGLVDVAKAQNKSVAELLETF